MQQNELAKFTETIGKAFQVSGATAKEAQSAIIQLTQGLQSGELRGEEFRSVMEQGARLAQLFADNIDGVNGNLGTLRSLAFSGQLTVDKLVRCAAQGRGGDRRRIHQAAKKDIRCFHPVRQRVHPLCRPA